MSKEQDANATAERLTPAGVEAQLPAEAFEAFKSSLGISGEAVPGLKRAAVASRRLPKDVRD